MNIKRTNKQQHHVIQLGFSALAIMFAVTAIILILDRTPSGVYVVKTANIYLLTILAVAAEILSRLA